MVATIAHVSVRSPMAALPCFTASIAYSIWWIRPAGDQVMQSVSYWLRNILPDVDCAACWSEAAAVDVKHFEKGTKGARAAGARRARLLSSAKKGRDGWLMLKEPAHVDQPPCQINSKMTPLSLHP